MEILCALFRAGAGNKRNICGVIGRLLYGALHQSKVTLDVSRDSASTGQNRFVSPAADKRRPICCFDRDKSHTNATQPLCPEARMLPITIANYALHWAWGSCDCTITREIQLSCRDVAFALPTCCV